MAATLTPTDRLAVGVAARKHLSRKNHAPWIPKLRKQDPLKLLHSAEQGRIPKLLQLKHQRMACSPFGFFRGAVPIMAYDLSVMPHTGLTTQLCGDAHIRNLGAFAGPDGRLVFDINDFDETAVGPFEWDVKRMATSLVLAGREAGGKEAHCREAAATFLERYTGQMRAFSKMPVLEVVKFQVHRLQDVGAVEQILQLAQRATPLSNLTALTQTTAKKHAKATAAKQAKPPATGPARIFRTQKPVLERVTGAEAQQVVDSLEAYATSLLPERQRFLAQYRVLDVAFKVVGTGSVGLRDFVLYMEGNGPKDPLFLQIKEEAASAYAPYLKGPAHAGHNGRRVVEGERAMQLQSDPLLGWTTIDGRDYLVRQLNDHKASINLEDLKPSGLLEYAGVCGELLARGHARGGDCLVFAGYVGGGARFAESILDFAVTYADQTEKDWKTLVKSLKK